MTSTTATEVNNADTQEVKVLEKKVEDNVDATTDEKPAVDTEKTETLSKKTPPPTVHKVDYTNDTVYLYQFSRCPTVPSASPYCLKVETFLRMAEITYENIDHKMKYKSKKGQLPFIEINGQEIADSDVIIKTLSEQFNKNLDEGLTPEQLTTSHAFESMLNNHTSWVVRWWRYNNPKDFLQTSKIDIRSSLNSRLPTPVLEFFFKIGFKNHAKQAVGHGLGRHTTEEIYEFGKQDLKSLSQLLGDNDYFFGGKPHLLDCVAFSHLVQFLYVPFGGIDEWIKTDAANLVAFVDRMKENYWPDWDRTCKTLELNTHIYKEGEEPSVKEAEKELEKKKAAEEKKRLKEEKKKELAEKKKAEKEEREKKKKEEAERKKAEKEKAEKEKAEKAAAEKAEKEKAEAEAKAAADAAKEESKEAEVKTTEEVKESAEPKSEAAAADATAAAVGEGAAAAEEKKE